MCRVSMLVFLLVLPLFGSGDAPTQEPEPVAKVHLKIVAALNGDDLGTARVTSFKSETDGRDYAKQFRDNIASTIPYGVYRLRLYQDGFYTAEGQVVVAQPVVWVVMGLHVGSIVSPEPPWPAELSGIIRNIPSGDDPVWVRLAGVHSTVVRDAKVDDSGNFLIAGLRRYDKAVLVVWSGAKILDFRTVTIPTEGPLVIDLAQPSTGR